MLILGIYGSPRKDGNTDRMLDAFLEGAASAGAEVERLYARKLKINGCLGCGHCDEHGECKVKDDMSKVYPLLDRADRIAIASPIYFYGVTAQLKGLIDRSQAVFMRRELERKAGKDVSVDESRKGFLLSAGATRGKKLFECAILTARYFWDALGIAYAGELCFWEIDEKGAVSGHPSALEDCREAGGKLAL